MTWQGRPLNARVIRVGHTAATVPGLEQARYDQCFTGL